MNISLTPQLEQYLRSKVDTGRYHSTSEVVREALRMMEARDQAEHMKLEILRNDIREGLHSIEEHGTRDFDPNSIKARGRAKQHKEK